jgi:hypothetical protein
VRKRAARRIDPVAIYGRCRGGGRWRRDRGNGDRPALLFSCHVADSVKDGKLKVLLEAFEPPPIPVNIVYLGGGLRALKVRAFVDFAAPRLKTRLAADLRERSSRVAS